MTYKSKDIDYMDTLQHAIYKGMPDKSPEEREFTWNYVRKQVTLDDLHAYAISVLGKLVTFPAANFNGRVMVIFRTPPTPSELEILYKSTEARLIPKEEVYITYFEKTEIDGDEDTAMMKTILNSEISIIHPELILSFGFPIGEPHSVIDFKDAKAMTTYDLGYVFKNDGDTPVTEKKQWLWSDMLELLKHYQP